MALQTGTQFVEDLYGSAMSLAVNLESLTLDGTYATYNSAGMLGGYVHGYLKGFGQAVLTGKLRLQEGKGTIITGRWVHTPGPLSNGEFEVSWDAESKCMKGWWAEAINDFTLGVKKDWMWAPNQRLSNSLSALVHSVHMERYTVLCCWIFFLQTLMQTTTTFGSFPLASENVGKMHISFNVVYSLCYMSFLIAYRFMLRRPAAAYMAGVSLYTIGYMTFVGYFGIFEANQNEGTKELYFCGSLLFLLGSACLVAATASKTTWSPITRPNALFWGSACFLLGSVAFTADALRILLLGEKYTPWLASLGSVTFVLGRFYFIWGSTTPNVGFNLLPPKEKRPIIQWKKTITRLPSHTGEEKFSDWFLTHSTAAMKCLQFQSDTNPVDVMNLSKSLVKACSIKTKACSEKKMQVLPQVSLVPPAWLPDIRKDSSSPLP